MSNEPLSEIKKEKFNLNEEGFPGPDQKGTEKPVLQNIKPFAIITAFRNGNSLSKNLLRNAKLVQAINTELDMPGFYKLIGFWAEKHPEAANMPYKEALDKGLVQDPSKEESLLIVKPEAVDYDTFATVIFALAKRFDQDGVIICDGSSVYLFDTAKGEPIHIGNKLVLSQISKAYSALRKKSNIPFVFAGTQQPSSVWTSLTLGKEGINHLSMSADMLSDMADSIDYVVFFKDAL